MRLCGKFTENPSASRPPPAIFVQKNGLWTIVASECRSSGPQGWPCGRSTAPQPAERTNWAAPSGKAGGKRPVETHPQPFGQAVASGKGGGNHEAQGKTGDDEGKSRGKGENDRKKGEKDGENVKKTASDERFCGKRMVFCQKVRYFAGDF